MKKVRPVWLWRIACVLWLVLIFSQSAMPGAASQAESDGLLSILDGVLPFLTEYLLRKLAHIGEFAILGILLGKSLGRADAKLLLVGLLCALADETIQLFVSGRSSQVSDVWVDFLGILAAAVLLRLCQGCRERRNARKRKTNTKK